jgi:hypothetical protein
MPVKDKGEDHVGHVDHDPTIHHVPSDGHGEASATRNIQVGKSNDAQGHSHQDGANINLNSIMKKEVKTILHKLMIVILHSIMTMMMKMMAPFKDQLKCHILECINPFNGTIMLITY